MITRNAEAASAAGEPRLHTASMPIPANTATISANGISRRDGRRVEENSGTLCSHTQSEFGPVHPRASSKRMIAAKTHGMELRGKRNAAIAITANKPTYAPNSQKPHPPFKLGRLRSWLRDN